MRVKSDRFGPTARRVGPDAGRPVRIIVAALAAAGLASGCGLTGGGKAGAAKAAAPDSPAVLRQDVDQLRGELADLRTRLETIQRGGTEHVDRVAQETRAEFEAVRKSMEAASRHEVQRQVEVLDAQSRRIDLLEKRAADLAQSLRRIELSLGGLENQLSRVLEGASGAKSGGSGRAPASKAAARPTEESASAPAPEPNLSASAAGAGLTPPAMLGSSPAPKSATPASPAPFASSEPASREAKAAPPAARHPEADPARVAKAAPTVPETKPAAAERPPPRPAASGTAMASPRTGSLTAQALFDRAMENWNKGEQGQAVLEFEELVQTFPTDPLAGSAQFRIGEAYYASRDFERAAVEYRKAVNLAPKGKDTPQALLRLGLAYRAQKRESDARQAWSQLVRDFPESDASEEARRALRGR